MGDKWRVAKLRGECLKASETQIFAEPEETTRVLLRVTGFSPAIIERFFEPFFGGVFLERNLSSSARWFRWLFRLFATGFAAVPELGMEQIPAQMAGSLPAGVLKCGAAVQAIERVGDGWRVDAGDAGVFAAAQVVMAAREPEAKGLLARLRKPGAAPARIWNRATTIYYAASQSPVDEPVIVLNGDGPTAGPVNHMAVMTMVSPAYAPPGSHLICANVVGAAPETDDAMEALEVDVRAQMRRWFGNQVNAWGALAGYPIAHALPMQSSLQPARPAPIDTGIILCGDYASTASIQGALVSGAKAAEMAQASMTR